MAEMIPMWYNSSCLDEQNTEALCFSKAANLSQSYIVGKAPFTCGLMSSAVRLGNGSTCEGRFVMAHHEQEYTKETLTRDWLYQKYIVEQLDCTQIGKIINRDSKTVWYWLKKYGIQTWPRGSNYKQNLNHGREPGWNHTEETKRKVGKASRKRGAVPYLKNGKHWLKSVSPEENPNWKGGITPERQTFYRSREWKKAVKNVWKRDNATCQRCGLSFKDVDRNSTRFHIHHIVSFEIQELRADPSNLVLLCPDCHYWVHSNQNGNGEFLA